MVNAVFGSRTVWKYIYVMIQEVMILWMVYLHHKIVHWIIICCIKEILQGLDTFSSNLLQRWPVKAQMRLFIYTVLPEPLLFIYIKHGGWKRVTSKIKSLASYGSYACMFKLWFYTYAISTKELVCWSIFIGSMPINTCADPEVETGVGTPPPENHKNIGFLSNTCPGPLKNHKAAKPAFNVANVGQSSASQRNTI